MCDYIFGVCYLILDFIVLSFLVSDRTLNDNLVNVLKNFSTRKALETCIKLQGRLFTCKELRMVKIKCSKDDGRVHTLAHMFRANGIPLENIYVRRSGNACESYLFLHNHFIFPCNISISLLLYMCICYLLRYKEHIALFMKS